jgi:hypothetical protein
MAKQRTASPSRTMKPVFLIFCEGETEEAYLDYLKQAYRSPIRIVPKIGTVGKCLKSFLLS